MIIDCDGCAMRDIACGDCVVTVLLGPTRLVELDPDETQALGVLADAGLVPPLRLVPGDGGGRPGDPILPTRATG